MRVFANRSLAIGLIFLLTFGLFAYPLSNSSVVQASDIQNPLDKGATGLGQAVRRLGTIGSVLHTGAHPDDEDSGLLAYLARGRQARTAYLSLTRGDGGQNLIGPELYESLGVIRTEELLVARRIDGAGQFFTRAFDFGFSKSKEEAISKWDREEVLRDMVRVIRTFRPFVIASAWSGTPRDGHGHHQAAGTLTQEAYKAAADPSRFPEQIAEGLRPWKAMKLYQREAVRSQNPEGAEPSSQGAQQPPPTLTINTGQFDPLFGRSYYEIAIEGRSQHRSQDQGGIQRRGPRYSGLKLLDSSVGSPAEEKDIFEGIDANVTGISKFAGAAAPGLKEPLAEVQAAADEAKGSFTPFAATSLTLIIARGLKKIREIRSTLKSMGLSEAEFYETDFLLNRKEQDFSDALAKAEGVVVDCIVEDEIVIPGQTFNLSVSTYADSAAKLSGIEIPVAKGWAVTKDKESGNVIDGRLIAQTDFKVTVAQSAEPTEPYWLKQRRKGDMFVTESGNGIAPLSPPEIVANVQLEIAGQKVNVTQPAQYRFADKALGEIRRDIKIAPAISVNVSPGLLMIPMSAKDVEREVTVTLTNNRKDTARGTLSLAKRFEGTVTPAKVDFELKRKGERASFNFAIKISPQRRELRYQLTAIATMDGANYRRGYQAIAYPHTESRFRYSDSVAQAQVLDVKVAAGLKVGYIEGAGDDFANALRRIDVDVRTIDSQELATGDLSRYDVIVTGIRAYEVRPDVIANNQRLLDYMRHGGTLIVQYNKNEYAAGNFAPYPVKMARTPDRVTDERATMTILDPSNPRFNYPNKIGPKDFEGWVQERGTYYFSEWDSHYKPTVESNDVGEKPKQGGELVAQVGNGTYVYTGIAWFRQLPEGVPGAYRLIANLVSLAKPKNQPQSSGQPARR